MSSNAVSLPPFVGRERSSDHQLQSICFVNAPPSIQRVTASGCSSKVRSQKFWFELCWCVQASCLPLCLHELHSLLGRVVPLGKVPVPAFYGIRPHSLYTSCLVPGCTGGLKGIFLDSSVCAYIRTQTHTHRHTPLSYLLWLWS